jgi:hypothetical protein
MKIQVNEVNNACIHCKNRYELKVSINFQNYSIVVQNWLIKNSMRIWKKKKEES